MLRPNAFLIRLNSFHLIVRHSLKDLSNRCVIPVLLVAILASCSPNFETEQVDTIPPVDYDANIQEWLVEDPYSLRKDIFHDPIECNFKSRRFNFGLGDLSSAYLCEREGKIDEALKYREVASLQGHFTSSRKLASQFETGDGAPKNLRRAYFYYAHIKDTVLRGYPNWAEYVQAMEFQNGGEIDSSWKVLIQETNRAQARLRPYLSGEDLYWVETELARHRDYRKEYSKRKEEYYKRLREYYNSKKIQRPTRIEPIPLPKTKPKSWWKF